MNQSDAERIAGLFDSLGFIGISDMENADIAVVVMCSVRQMAADRIFGLEQKIKNIKKRNKKFIAVLTGCVVESDKKRFLRVFDHILDIKTLPRWPDILNLGPRKRKQYRNFPGSAKSQKPNLCDSRKNIEDYFEIPPKHPSKFCALIPISKGCDNFCSYCVVPYTRGPLKPRPVSKIVGEIKNAIKSGAKVIWLLGQNVNNYHYGKTDFSRLLRIVNDIPGDFWIRFTSPHPKDFDNAAILAMAECQKVSPYLNLPVQSGDNTILKAMKRPYTLAQYEALVKNIRDSFQKHRKGLEKEVAISTDVIVGFPQETKDQFQNTAKAFKKIKYDMAYISRYSKRPGTAAALLDDNVTDKEKKRREEALNDIVKNTAFNHNKKYIGKDVDVLVNRIKENFALGKDRHYKTVKFTVGTRKIKAGDIVKVKIVKVMPFGLSGKIQE